MDEILSAILDLPLDFIGHRELLGDAVDQARRFDLTVYDAVFLALARSHHAELISGDDKLLQAWRRAGAA